MKWDFLIFLSFHAYMLQIYLKKTIWSKYIVFYAMLSPYENLNLILNLKRIGQEKLLVTV